MLAPTFQIFISDFTFSKRIKDTLQKVRRKEKYKHSLM